MNEEQLKELSESLANRAKRSRRSAWFSAGLIVLTVFLIITFFYAGALLGTNRGRYEVFNKSQSGEIGSSYTDLPPEIASKRLDLELKKAEIELKRSELEKASEEASILTATITESVTKIGAVLISIYLVQILLGLMRYHFKLADHIETMSEAVKIAHDDVDKLEKITGVIGVAHIDFGKSPQSPIDKITNLVKDLGNQVASIRNKLNK
jgi:hypothetical protein